MPRSRVSGLVLDERLYLGSTTPPQAFEDRSRGANVPSAYGAGVTWAQEASGLWTRSFNGIASAIRFTNAEKLNLRGNFTIEYWFKPVDITRDSRDIIDKGFANFITLGHRSSKLFFGYPAVTSTVAGLTTMTGSGIWYYAAFAWDGTNINLYLNGIVDKTSAITMPTDQTERWNIGYNNFGGYYTGSIWGVRFRSHTRTAAKIRARFNATRHWFGV